jgi:hypothetical protein
MDVGFAPGPHPTSSGGSGSKGSAERSPSIDAAALAANSSAAPPAMQVYHLPTLQSENDAPPCRRGASLVAGRLAWEQRRSAV